MGAALAAAAAGVALAAGIAIGSLVIAQPKVVTVQTAPAPASSFDRGWSTDSSNVALPRVGTSVGVSPIDELRTRDQAVKDRSLGTGGRNVRLPR
jgi:hypothetical protein